MKSQGEFQILTQKYWLLIDRPIFLKKNHFGFLFESKKVKKSLFAKWRPPPGLQFCEKYILWDLFTI